MQMIAYSMLNFAFALSLYYFTLILISLLHHRAPVSHPLLGFIRSQLGWMQRWPFILKVLAPLIVTTVLWVAISPLLVWLNVLTATESLLHTLEQGVVIGLGSYSIWQVPLGIILFLHLVNSYVYLGRHAIWELVDETGRRILLPLRLVPLRLGKVDFAPVVGLALVFFAGQQLLSLLPRLFNRLPL